MKLTAITVREMATPGGSHIQGLFSRMNIDWAAVIMLPHVGVGICTPMPRKLSAGLQQDRPGYRQHGGHGHVTHDAGEYVYEYLAPVRGAEGLAAMT